MPGFRTHYVFGIESRNTLKKIHTPESLSIWDMVRSHPGAYAIGQQGPDIFFYNPPSYAHKRNTGERMHHENTLDFICNLIKVSESVNNADLRAIAHAYTAGFIGHYTLDTSCHPYIHFRTCKDINDHSNRGFYNHMFLETDIDAAMTAHFLKLRPSEFSPSATIHLTREEAVFLSAVIQRAIAMTYPESVVLSPEVTSAFRFTRIVYDLMEDKNKWKKKLVRSLEDDFLHHPQFSAMIADDDQTTYTDPCNLRHLEWQNPWDTSIHSTESFYDLFRKAEKQYIRRLYLFFRVLSSDFGSRDYYAYEQNLENELGNLSYDSGLTL